MLPMHSICGSPAQFLKMYKMEEKKHKKQDKKKPTPLPPATLEQERTLSS